jgi:hypothetical protein
VSFFVTQILGYQWTQKSSMILSTQAWNFGVNIGELFSSHTGLWNFSWSARSEHVLYPASFLAPSLMEIQTWFEWGRKQLQPIFTSFYYKESCCRFWCFWPICGFELFKNKTIFMTGSWATNNAFWTQWRRTSISRAIDLFPVTVS